MASTIDPNRTLLDYGPQGTKGPFSNSDMDRLSEALTMSSWETGIDFSVYIGDLGQDRRAKLAELHRSFGASAPNTCLVAVSPNERVVEIGVGEIAAKRLPDRSCNLAVLAMTANFEGGDLVGGIVNGLRMLSDQAGHPHRV
ncbi:DUF5130 family protein [Epidermidibacterium keratini]|uniref:DUF5130 family protein n=1 Tax=Epidermidibacterium keratini TaxID=1891644 RepID=A0A7L4YJC0_9ACTN|nr:DUF5130 family protein [Epidermidibacterium keratini]QHB99394.1 DUF5130 family protein [Epidermidibacterium keratini]